MKIRENWWAGLNGPYRLGAAGTAHFDRPNDPLLSSYLGLNGLDEYEGIESAKSLYSFVKIRENWWAGLNGPVPG